MSREQMLVEIHGMVTTKADAAKILRCSRDTLNNLIRKGKIMMCCEGTKVDVRSIAAYMDMPPPKKPRWHVDP